MVGEDRLATALERLVASGVISAEQRGAVQRAVAEQERARRAPVGRVLAEIVAYLGAGLVAAGLVLFLDRAWVDIARSGRVVLLVVVAGCAVGGAVVLAGGCRGVFRRVPIASAGRVRLAAVLLALAAGSATGAVATALDGRGSGADLVAAGAGLLVAVLGYLLVPSLLGMVTVVVFGVVTILEATSSTTELRSLWQGIALLAFGACWFGLALARRVVVEWAGYVLGGIVAVLGAQSVTVGDSPWRPVLTGAIGVLCLALYLVRREPALVLVGAAAAAIAVVQTVSEHTEGGPAAATMVLGIGAVVLTAGVLVLTTRPRGPG